MSFKHSLNNLNDNRTLAQLITKLEQGDPETYRNIESIGSGKFRSHRIGVTGSAGTGKSSLINHLISFFRSKQKSVGVLSVDPSSVFSGGAVLGDRVRMQQHAEDDGVFIRSLATRDFKGHLASAIWSSVALLEASGKDIVIIETSGSGQTDSDIYYVADTVTLLLVPEGGDAIQTLKSGIMEIADIYVVNKADRPGADTLTKTLNAHLRLAETSEVWKPPIVKTQANKGTGIGKLCEAIEQHHLSLIKNPSSNKTLPEQRRREFTSQVELGFSRILRHHLANNKESARLLKDVESAGSSPQRAAQKLICKIAKLIKDM